MLMLKPLPALIGERKVLWRKSRTRVPVVSLSPSFAPYLVIIVTIPPSRWPLWLLNCKRLYNFHLRQKLHLEGFDEVKEGAILQGVAGPSQQLGPSRESTR
jgi:hypothetical protein